MAIDPEIIPSSSSDGFHAVRSISRWFVYAAMCMSVLIIVGLVKTLFPLILMAGILSFIWSQAKIQ